MRTSWFSRQGNERVRNNDAAEVHARLKQEQAQPRHGFLRDIGSYCIVTLDLDTLAAQVWHCDDCQVGLRHQTETRWLDMPHILAKQPGLPSSRCCRAKCCLSALTATGKNTLQQVRHGTACGAMPAGSPTVTGLRVSGPGHDYRANANAAPRSLLDSEVNSQIYTEWAFSAQTPVDAASLNPGVNLASTA